MGAGAEYAGEGAEYDDMGAGAAYAGAGAYDDMGAGEAYAGEGAYDDMGAGAAYAGEGAYDDTGAVAGLKTVVMVGFLRSAAFNIEAETRPTKEASPLSIAMIFLMSWVISLSNVLL